MSDLIQNLERSKRIKNSRLVEEISDSQHLCCGVTRENSQKYMLMPELYIVLTISLGNNFVFGRHFCLSCNTKSHGL